MKKELIQVGKTYHNGKEGRSLSVRKVIGEGSQYVLYNGQEDADCLRYLQVKGIYSGQESNITRTSFSQWAKGEFDSPQATGTTEPPSHVVTAAESEVYGNDCPNGQC